jgi:L-aspartate oxidase
MAIALRAGAVMADVEFVQFHPTVLWLGEAANGQQPLISEAVRGEGGFLVDGDGVRFMQGVHEMADLAPRDVVARAIVARMRETGTDHVYLDARHLGREFVERRFPSIVASLREHGFDLAADLVPVAPAQHYASGGVKVDLHGRSSLDGLYACGEASCTGVHGANRLASNSLLEGLVFAHRIADDITARFAAGELAPATPAAPTGETALLAAEHRRDVQRAMTAGSGVVRSAESLAGADHELATLAKATESDRANPEPAAWEATNLLHLGQVLTTVAALREETRGGHLRSDFPERDDEDWLGHLHAVRRPDGTVKTSYHPLPVTAGSEPA